MILLLALMLLPVIAPRSEACDCAPPLSPLEQRVKSDAVFEAIALDAEYPALWISGGDMVRWTLAVNHAWKGVPVDTVTLYSARDGAACGYQFEIGQGYLVYAWLRDSLEVYPSYVVPTDDGPIVDRALTTGACSRTMHIKDALYDLHELGTPPVSLPGEAFPDISVEGILRQLSSPDDRLRWAATETLVVMGEHLDAVVADLISRLREGTSPGQGRAVGMLGRIGPPAQSAVPVLAGIMSRRSAGEDSDDLASAIRAALVSITEEPVWPPIPAVHADE